MNTAETSTLSTVSDQSSQKSVRSKPVRSRAMTVLLNFGSLSMGGVVCRMMGLVTNAVLGRRISAAGFGIIGIAQSATLYFTLFSDLGLSTVALREGAQHPEKLQKVISSIFGLRLTLALIAIPAGLLTTQFLPYSEASRNLFRIYLITMPIQALSVEWVFRSTQKMYLNAALQIAGALLTFVLTLMLVRGAGDVILVAEIAAFVALADIVLGIYLLSRQGYSARPIFSIRDSRYFLMQSLPLCAATFAITLYAQANNLILGAVRGNAEVGLYVAATKVSQACLYPVWLYYGAMTPALMEVWTASRDQAKSFLSSSVRATAIVSIGCGLVAASAGEWALTRLFGKTFSGSGAAFELLVWAGVVIAIGHHWGELCIASKNNRRLMQSTFLGAFVNLAVCAATVSRIGILGAALGILAAEIAAFVFLIVSFGWELGLSVLRAALKPVLAGAGSYVIVLGTRSNGPALSATLAVISYSVLLFLFGGLTRHDLSRLRALVPIRRCVLESQP